MEIPTIQLPPRITREYLRSNLGINFVFSDTYYQDSIGKQAKELRGEFNSFSVPTKLRGCVNDPTSFFSDKYFEMNCKCINAYIHKIPLHKPIVVLPKIGLGNSEMPVRCPETYKYLIAMLRQAVNPVLVNPIVFEEHATYLFKLTQP